MPVEIKNYIGGEFQDAKTGKTITSINPAVNEVCATLPDSTADDVEAAVTAAKKAFAGWSNTPAIERGKILSKIADTIADHLNSLAKEESIDSGKPIQLARTIDIPRAEQNFRFFATAIQHTSNEAFETDSVAINYTLRQPIGVAGCISPWNLPLYLFTWKIAPALASGNCVVAKPSNVTPTTAFRLSEICHKAGLPKGVLNIVHGRGSNVGSAITKHPDVPAISFTGGTQTGATIAQVAAPMFKKLSLELGGKNPNIIFADCNYGEMLTTTVRSSFANQGQVCLAGSRIFVEKSLYENFKKDFVERVGALQQGDPLEQSTEQGAVVSKDQMEKVLSCIELARKEGGKVLCGGERLIVNGRCKNGFFVQPTVIEGLTSECRTNQEEIFGPVVTIMPFEREDEVLAWANSTSYGLAASIWTENLSRAHRMARDVQSGIIWINCWMLRDLRTPFGGMKNSGMGREGGFEALRFFTETKNVCIPYGGQA